jgi:hypothetical protein
MRLAAAFAASVSFAAWLDVSFIEITPIPKAPVYTNHNEAPKQMDGRTRQTDERTADFNQATLTITMKLTPAEPARIIQPRKS